MSLPSQAQVYAALRYAGVITGVVVTGAATLGALPADTAAAIVTSAQKVISDTQTLIGDAWALAVLVAPVITVWLVKIGVSSASLTKQLKSITSNSDVQIEGQIKVPANVADAVPSDKVVAK